MVVSMQWNIVNKASGTYGSIPSWYSHIAPLPHNCLGAACVNSLSGATLAEVEGQNHQTSKVVLSPLQHVGSNSFTAPAILQVYLLPNLANMDDSAYL